MAVIIYLIMIYLEFRFEKENLKIHINFIFFFNKNLYKRLNLFKVLMPNELTFFFSVK